MAQSSRNKRGPGLKLPFRYVLLAILLSLLAVGLGSLLFFRVAAVEVRGNDRYSTETILEASGLRTGGAMLSVNPGRTAKNITQKLSYVDAARVTLQYPNRVVIQVTERYPVAALFVGGDWWILDKNCRLLEYGTQNSAATRVVISGITGIKASLGEIITVAEEDEGKLDRLSLVLAAVHEARMEGRITALDIRDAGNILLSYGPRVTVELGSGEGAAEKLLLLGEVADMLDLSKEGTVSFGGAGEVHYVKKDEPSR